MIRTMHLSQRPAAAAAAAHVMIGHYRWTVTVKQAMLTRWCLKCQCARGAATSGGGECAGGPARPGPIGPGRVDGPPGPCRALPPMMLPIQNPNLKTHPNPILTLTRTIFDRKKRHRNIGQHRVMFTGYFAKERWWVYERPISENRSFSILDGAHARRTTNKVHQTKNI